MAAGVGLGGRRTAGGGGDGGYGYDGVVDAVDRGSAGGRLGRAGWPGSSESYPATRAAFAAGRLRVEQVRVIVTAAERAPVGVSREQLHAAEAELVAKATGVGSRSGRPLNAKRLRQVARRMFEVVSVEVADRHESDQLNAEADRAEAGPGAPCTTTATAPLPAGS